MLFIETNLAGLLIVEPEPIADARGFFARTWCQTTWQERGLDPRLVQCNISYNQLRGTLRGMHYQAAPYGEVKLVRCTTGAIYDVVVDLRPDSPTYTRWVGVELSAANRRALYIPEGLAHGFQTLADHSEVFYQMSEYYHPASAGGVRWDDPAFAIDWPIEEKIISERDRQFADFRP
jgi:dTDP-4-dehydrorhamnose 3,5-epimerase